MHTATLVIGPDVEAQMAPHTGEDGWCDWWGIGGRYTGRLILKPGAEGKVFGDAVPLFEAMFSHAISEQLPTATTSRCAAPGDGVDQARLRDIEKINASLGAVVVGGVLHEPDEDEFEAWWKEVGPDARRPTAEIMPRWVERMNELLALADPDDLVTVVDVHW
jgi:hypothetical protein